MPVGIARMVGDRGGFAPGRCLAAALLVCLAGCIDDADVDPAGDAGDDGGVDTETGTGQQRPLLVTFIDVGQGDAALFELPDGTAILIDGGPNEAGRDLVAPILEEKGIEVLDLMVLTHPHADHCGGLDEILEDFDVVEIWENGETLDTMTYQEYAEARDAEGALIELVEQGETREYGDVSLRVLHSDCGYEGANNDSIVILFSFGTFDVLTTGDVEAEAQLDLVADHGDQIASEVVKVPHHGSHDFDHSFVEAVAADFGVISCGVDNDFGHPHQEAIDAWRQAGTALCCTADSGDVELRSHGVSFEYDCAAPLAH